MLRFPFERKFNILLVDDDENILDIYSDYLSMYPAYTVSKASTVFEAEKILSNGLQFHSCLFDLGMRSPDLDEFYLLKKYKTKVPFIIVSGSTDIIKGWNSFEHGAFSIVQKPVDTNSLTLIEPINKGILFYFLAQCFLGLDYNTIERIFNALMAHEVDSIDQLAYLCCMSESKLRKSCKQSGEFSPKEMYMATCLLIEVFNMYNRDMVCSFKSEYEKGKIYSDNTCGILQNLKRYYKNNKNLIHKYFCISE